MHLHHRFIVAGVRIIFRQEKQAKRGRRAVNKGLGGKRGEGGEGIGRG